MNWTAFFCVLLAIPGALAFGVGLAWLIEHHPRVAVAVGAVYITVLAVVAGLSTQN